MEATQRIPDTEEAWDTGELGADEAFVGHLSEDERAADFAAINESLGLQPISIRLEKSLIDDFKSIATINGLGYQTLMRQALKRFAECEKKRIVGQMAAQMRERQSALADDKPRAQRQKKAA
ncbi:hypothetical protein [Rhodocyclus purpureus]|uniref:hypothetical protein n=1 Tax=Rhodocyclus purpureus TaxID=1067 RepID=UPI001912FC0F|nr:hypothetical protein [Rhodocyclus purpureus]